MQRIALVVGSSLVGDPLPAGEPFTVEVAGAAGAPTRVALVDHGAVVVLRRHGDGTTPAPRVDHHANVRALCAAGCDRVVALGSSGGLHQHLGPGTVLAPDDVLALTTYPTFHDTSDGYGVRGFDRAWRADVVDAWRRATSTPIVDGGTYAQSVGPRFETPAEIRFMAAFADVVGMTLAAELFLAAEAGLRYAAICKVDNLGNGLVPGEDPLAAYALNAEHGAAAFASDVAAVVAELTS